MSQVSKITKKIFSGFVLGWMFCIGGFLIGASAGICYSITHVDHKVQELQQEVNESQLEAATCKLEQEQGCVCPKDASASFRRQAVGKWTL